MAPLKIHAGPATPPPADGESGSIRLFLPLVTREDPVAPAREWDSRLDQRGTVLIPAQVQPGQGYWRLVKGVRYAENEPPFAGMHYILLDTLDAAGMRQTDVPIRISTADDAIEIEVVRTEAKPG